MKQETETDYPYIHRWGQMMGSGTYYIDQNVRKAKETGAPRNAVYPHDDGTWATTDDIKRKSTRRMMDLEPITPIPHAVELCQDDGTKYRWALNDDQRATIWALLVENLGKPAAFVDC
jgi:hypothetical protein